MNVTNPFGKGISGSDFFLLDVGEGGVEFGFKVDQKVEDLLSDAVSIGSCFLFTFVVLSGEL